MTSTILIFPTGHPKCRLFITHAGLFSVMEATYHGIPILTIPVFFDQHPNSFKAENEGWSRSLELDLINEELFEESLNDLLDNPKYGKLRNKCIENMYAESFVSLSAH